MIVERRMAADRRRAVSTPSIPGMRTSIEDEIRVDLGGEDESTLAARRLARR